MKVRLEVEGIKNLQLYLSDSNSYLYYLMVYILIVKRFSMQVLRI